MPLRSINDRLSTLFLGESPLHSLPSRHWPREISYMAGSFSPITVFLSGKRYAVAGVSRQPGQAANAVFRKLRDAGYEVFAVNPHATEVEGVPCYPNLAAIPGQIDGVVIATHPSQAAEVVRQCAAQGIGRVWLHRSFGAGSVSDEAVREAAARGIGCIVGGCPLMYIEPVDMGHRCMRWWLKRSARVPG